MDILESGLDNLLGVRLQNLDMISAVQLDQLYQHPECHRKHLRDKQGVLLCHLFGKEQASCLVVNKFCHLESSPLAGFDRRHQTSDANRNRP